MSFLAPRGCARLLVLVAVAATAAGCGCTPPKPTQIWTDPSGAKVQVNGKDLAVSPTAFPFDFCTDGHPAAYDVTATKDGYYDGKLHVVDGAADLATGLVKIVLTPDAVFGGTVPSEAANNWVFVQADPKLPKDVVWQKLVSAATDRYTHCDLLEVTSGHLETAKFSHEFPHPSGKPTTVRTQLVADISSQQPLVYKVRLVSQIAYGTEPDKWSDYARVFPEDAKLIDTIRTQIGIQTPGGE